MTTGAQALVDCVLRERIDHVFGIPGTMNLLEKGRAFLWRLQS
jgi:thiamine pyrophosphate-dependent acetolactate synthase large subunit-like protein